MVIVEIIQAILGRVFTEKTLLYQIDFFELMKCAIDRDQIAFSLVFTFFKLRQNFFRRLGLGGSYQTINDLFALASDLDFILPHFRKNGGFSRRFMRSFGVFLHRGQNNTLQERRQGGALGAFAFFVMNVVL